MLLPCPGKDLGQQGLDKRSFVVKLGFSIRTVVAIVWLVPQVPGENAVVLTKCANYPLHIHLQTRILRLVRQRLVSRTLYPSGIVYARNWRMLRTGLRIRVPARIKQHKNRPDMVPAGNGQESIYALAEACLILLPEQVVQ